MISQLNFYNYRLFTAGMNIGLALGMLISYFLIDTVFFWMIFIFQVGLGIYGGFNEGHKLVENGIFQKRH